MELLKKIKVCLNILILIDTNNTNLIAKVTQILGIGKVSKGEYNIDLGS